MLTLTVSPAGLHTVEITASNGSYMAQRTIEYSIPDKDTSNGQFCEDTAHHKMRHCMHGHQISQIYPLW